MLGSHFQLAVAAVAGLISHWAFFVHGEHDLAAGKIARLYVLAVVLTPLTECVLADLSFQQAVKESMAIDAAYIAALFTSIMTFRLFLSPLRHIPGPSRLRLTKLTHVWDMAHSQNCKILHGYHTKYGDVVRTGPNEVTLFGTEAFYKVYGSDSTCDRAAYYDLLHPMVSLDTTRDPMIHAHRRRVWDQAFSMRSLEKAEPLIYEEADKLVKQLQSRENESIDISAWLEYYTFDLMGRFGLTIDFNNLSRGHPHPILALYHMAHRRLGPLAAAPWIKHLLMGIPYIERMKYYRQFMDWAAAELDKNIKNNEKGRTNVIGYVLDDAIEHGGISENWRYILGDFVLVIVAGSDPVRQVLANLIYYLIRNPQHCERIREELALIDKRDYKAVQRLQHLNACIYETLRLNPAVPSAGLRIAPRGGLIISGTLIPEGTTIVVPQYSLLRDRRNFVKPDEWVPERFSTQPELVLDKSAFVPWSAGRYACIGKNLSLMEIRVAAALILTTFEMDFAPNEDGERMFIEACDYFTTTPGPLHLSLTSNAALSNSNPTTTTKTVRNPR